MGRTIIVGDIHGCFDELQRLLGELDFSDADEVVSVGDLVDRGPQSLEVWDFFRQRPNASAIMGNHERKHVRGILSYSQEIVRLQLGARYQEFREWATHLPYYLDRPEALIVHGGFENGVDVARQRQDVLAATTSGSKYLEVCYPNRHWADEYTGDKPIVFGHQVVGDHARCFGRNAYGIDTGACHGGYLTGLVLPDFQLHRVKSRRDYWTSQQQRWEIPVLQSRPWDTFRWKKLTRELALLQGSKSPNARDFARQLERQLADVDGLISSLIERLEAHCASLQEQHDSKELKRAIAKQPYPSLLFAAVAGSLSFATVKAHLTTPSAVRRAADAYPPTTNTGR